MKTKQIIEDQLISFETAKLSKEKGFDLKVPHCYNLIVNQLDDTEWDVIINWNDNKTKTFSAPTQALLQRWLREKHKLHLYITWYGVFEVYVARDKIAPEITEDGFDTYEEALEQGLLIGLNLINNENPN